jgi:FecR protein
VDYAELSKEMETPSDEVRRLISDLCDNRIGPAELRQLEDELTKSAEARALYIDYLDLHASLGWEVTARQPVEELVIESIVNGHGCVVGEPARDTQKAVPTLPHRARRLPFGLAAALLVTAGLAIWWASGSGRVASILVPSPNAPLAERSADDSAIVVPILGRVANESPGCEWYVEHRADIGDRSLRVGETLRVLKGEMSIAYDRGIFISLSAPAIYEFSSPMSARLIRGQLKARVDKGAEGFTVKTPRAKVVDYGTEFGIDVNGLGSTDVVVFKGQVGVEYTSKGGERLAVLQRLRMGQGIRVDEVGTVSRLVAITSSSFPGGVRPQAPVRPLIISSVRDNIKRPGAWSFYEIVHAGLQEDGLAFVDREFHQWNGVDASGMPAYLLGADYVRMFNDDKVDDSFEMYVTIDRPAMLYVFFDDRLTPPKWLRDNFRDTGHNIGMDVGPFTEGELEFTAERFGTGVGPGASVENTLSIWQRRVPKPTTLWLGATEAPNTDINMYAVAATPLKDAEK